MSSFRHWVRREVLLRWKDTPYVGDPTEVIYHTFDVLQERALLHGRQALLQGMGAEKRYEHDAVFHHAVDVMVQAVVAGVFGEIPLTKEEKQTKLEAFQKLTMAPLTMQQVMDVKKQWEDSAPKSGLPKAQQKRQSEEAALKALLASVQAKSDQLLGITQQEKYNELMGIDPEEI